MERFKKVTNELCMIGSIVLIAVLFLIWTINYETPEKIRISEHTIYTEGKTCVINMRYSREVHYIHHDMAECMNQHALAINRMLVKNYGAK